MLKLLSIMVFVSDLLRKKKTNEKNEFVQFAVFWLNFRTFSYFFCNAYNNDIPSSLPATEMESLILIKW